MPDTQHDHSPAERMHLIALAVHRVTDRFAAYDESFGKRLRDTATGLLEDIAIYGSARQHDAAGTTKFIHTIVGRLEALKALLSFVKSRGQAAPATVDIVLWHLDRLLEYFHQEDAHMEDHIGKLHPQGAILGGKFSDIAPQPIPVIPPQPPRPVQKTYDSLLGPDAGGAFPPRPSPFAAAATIATGDDHEAYASHNNGTGGNGHARQKRILDFFALRRRAQLKEVTAIFPGVSEKTVRNDLAELCRAGQLRRVGLAPRSHYLLTA